MKFRGLWGLEIKSKKVYDLTINASFRIAMASIYQFNGSGRTSVRMEFQGSSFLLCSLIPEKIEQQVIDITCLEGERISFRSEGPNGIHLMGNYISQEDSDSEEEALSAPDDELEKNSIIIDPIDIPEFTSPEYDTIIKDAYISGAENDDVDDNVDNNVDDNVDDHMDNLDDNLDGDEMMESDENNFNMPQILEYLDSAFSLPSKQEKNEDEAVGNMLKSENESKQEDRGVIEVSGNKDDIINSDQKHGLVTIGDVKSDKKYGRKLVHDDGSAEKVEKALVKDIVLNHKDESKPANNIGLNQKNEPEPEDDSTPAKMESIKETNSDKLNEKGASSTTELTQKTDDIESNKVQGREKKRGVKNGSSLESNGTAGGNESNQGNKVVAKKNEKAKDNKTATEKKNTPKSNKKKKVSPKENEVIPDIAADIDAANKKMKRKAHINRKKEKQAAKKLEEEANEQKKEDADIPKAKPIGCPIAIPISNDHVNKKRRT